MVKIWNASDLIGKEHTITVAQNSKNSTLFTSINKTGIGQLKNSPKTKEIAT